MPIPEMTKSIKRWFMDIGDDLPYTVGGFKAEVEEDRQACYAAGKADALPQWPPEEGKVFVIGKGLNFCGQVLGRWNGTNWDRRLDIPGEKWFSDEPSDGITAAYLLGELEEVK